MASASLPTEVPDALSVIAWRNLHLPGHTWSVRVRGQSRVGFHTKSLLLRDVSFRVQPAGQARARRTGQRNVHASVVGTSVSELVCPCVGGCRCEDGWVSVSYNPFGPNGFFALEDSHILFKGAAYARLNEDGLAVQFGQVMCPRP